MTIEQRLQVLEDTLEITHLKASYLSAADCGWQKPSCDAEAVASLFIADGVWDCGSYGRAAGRDQIRAHFKSFDRITFDFHLVGNPVIKVSGDTATGEWHGFFPLTSGGESRWLGGVYNDQFVRTPEGWKFKKLTLTPAFASKNEQGFEVKLASAASAATASQK
jgi:hypothetical protein